MGTIPQELVTFKSTVEPNLDSMSSTCTSIVEKVAETINANESARSGISTYYNSQNKQTVLGKFTSINDTYSKISSSVSTDLKGMIDDAKTIVDLVKELEKINEEIEGQQQIINAESGDTDESKRKIDDAKSIINSKNSEFETKKNDALTKLESLKAKDANLDFVSAFNDTDYTSKLDQLQGGKFIKEQSFTASNGVTVKYHVYVPEYGEDVEVPVCMYLPGSGETTDHSSTLTIGLPEMLNKGVMTPSGIVVCPEVPADGYFENAAYQQALVELSQQVCNDYNGDSERISLSGHSYGAIAGYDMIDRYPGYFSAFVPISGGSYEASSAMKDVKIWAFHGAGDNTGNRTNYSLVRNLISQLQRMGGQATLHTFENMQHRGTQNETFAREYQDSEGEMINPLEWAFRQKKDA